MNTFKRYFLKLLFITVSMLILSLPLVWLQIYYPKAFHSVSGIITEHFWVFTVLRLLLIAGFFVIWPVFIERFAKRHEWADAKTQFWLSQRFRIIGWMVVVEVMVCQNLLFHVFL
jgi:hypothetical protein